MDNLTEEQTKKLAELLRAKQQLYKKFKSAQSGSINYAKADENYRFACLYLSEFLESIGFQ